MNGLPYSIFDLQKHIAQDVWPNGAQLRCKICGGVKNISVDECANHLAHGWPKCCGKTTELIKFKKGAP